MNPLPPNADELVSAYLDGEAAPDEVAIVESSPELMERVEALRGVSDLLGAPIDVPAEAKEIHISAALDAFDALFSADGATDTSEEATPRLAAVPAATADPPQAEQPSAVASLAKARERRRPRRFTTGVIAAAAAAVLLFVAVAAFGFGGGDSLDVATSTAADSADAVDDASDDDAMEEAMDDDEAAAGSALNELQAAPAPTPAAPEAARVESAEALADEAAMDDEEATAAEAPAADQESAEDTVESEPEEADGAVDADTDAAGDADFLAEEPLLFTDLAFPDLESLLLELDTLPIEELQQRALLIEPGLFPGCQGDVADLAKVESPTLVGQTFIEDEPVEIHQTRDDDGEIVFVIVDTDCMIVQTTP